MWPIIIRELRIGSRRWTSYWLRLLAAAAVVASIFFWFEATRFNFLQAGGVLFGHMHRTMLVAIWILVPLMMCDCLSRERREGTLGLLFLTDLRAWDIVCAKAFVHVLHALTLWAAVLPIIAVPLLLGGLHWKAILLSVGWTLGSIFLAAAAGIAASSVSRRHAEAAILAIIFAAGFFIAYVAASASAVAFAFNLWFPNPGAPPQFFGDHLATGVNVFFGEEWTELFDLARDPYETKNLARDAQRKALLTRMNAEFDAQVKATGYHIPEYADKPGAPAAPKDGKKKGKAKE